MPQRGDQPALWTQLTFLEIAEVLENRDHLEKLLPVGILKLLQRLAMTLQRLSQPSRLLDLPLPQPPFGTAVTGHLGQGKGQRIELRPPLFGGLAPEKCQRRGASPASTTSSASSAAGPHSRHPQVPEPLPLLLDSGAPLPIVDQGRQLAAGRRHSPCLGHPADQPLLLLPDGLDLSPVLKLAEALLDGLADRVRFAVSL